MTSYEEKVNSFGANFSGIPRRNLARANFSRSPRAGFSDAVTCNASGKLVSWSIKLVNVNEGMGFEAVHAQ